MADTATTRQDTRTQVRVNSFIRSVYNWMAGGLALTGIVAYFAAHNQTLNQLIFGAPMVFFGLIIAELGMVFYLSARIQKMAAPGYFCCMPQ